MWKESPRTRARDLLTLDQAKAERYVVMMVESGTLEDMRAGIVAGLDPVPIIIDRGELQNSSVAALARVFLRAKWRQLSPILGDPKRVREMVRATDPKKGELLDTPEGYLWLVWTLYRTKTFLGWFARIKHMDRVIAPSGKCPLHLVSPALGESPKT